MKPTRRGFFKTLAFGILGKGFISSFPYRAFAKSGDYENGIEIEKGYIVFNNETQKSMEALADALLPGAKQIGIRTLFMDYISKDHGIAGHLDAGFWNLDTISKQRFKKPYYQLKTKKEKDAVLNHLLARSNTKKFIHNFKRAVVKLYYSSPEVWKKLSYNGPPQPRGFLDYYKPPTVS